MNDKKVLTREEMQAFDRKAIGQWGVPGVVLMENAGRNAFMVAMEMLERASGQGVAVLCGGGNNGGDGYVVARHLLRVGVPVRVYTAVDPERLKGDARTNMKIWRTLGGAIIPIQASEFIAAAASDWAGCALIVDGLLGTGFSGTVRSPLDEVIRIVNALDGPKVLALDVPSGLDCNTGRAEGETIRADRTVTFAARKVGFDAPEAHQYTGEVILVDIGVPCR
ncbi:MAG: NAD(P)H-hydrate epimerase [Phycisphaerales bacterium]|nr:MAG: NAD(P)H-hydrate epimerase [Phycisphaerales bacterium]